MTVRPGPTFMVTADLNGDGYQDLALVNREYDNHFSTFLGDGTGQLVPHWTVSTGSGPIHVSLADLDGDQQLDAVVSIETYQIRIYIGDGNGGFAESPESPLSLPHHGPMSVVEDVDHDGWLDLLVGSRENSDGYISVYLNDGSGGFSLNATHTITNGRGRFAAADFNEDGNVDVVTTDEHGFRLFSGNSAGELTESSASPVSAPSSRGPIQAGDLNGDGHVDVAFASTSTLQLSVMLGDGAGGFSFGPNSPLTLSESGAQVSDLVDLDGNGTLDVIVEDLAAQLAAVYLNSGTGELTEASASPLPNMGATIAGKLNGDVYPDLAGIHYYSDRLNVYLSNP